MNAQQQFAEARSALAQIQTEHDEAERAWKAARRALDEARAAARPPTVLLDLQHEVVQAGKRHEAAKQALEACRRRVESREKEALERIRAEMLAAYFNSASGLAEQLADLLEVHRRIGRADPLTLGRLFVPAFEPLPEQSPGALLSWIDFLDSPERRAAAQRVEATLTRFLAEEAPPEGIT